MDARGARTVFGTLLAAGAIAGCSFFRGGQARPPAPDVYPEDRRQLSVPFFRQNSDQCGPSAEASVLSFWGAPVDVEDIKGQVYSSRLKGSLPIDLLLAAQYRGFKAHLYKGSLADIKAELKMGHPLIAYTNRGFEALPVWHYVVVTGYDEARGGLTVHSGLTENKFVTYKDFSAEWDKAQRSTLLILPPARDGESPHAGT